MKLKKNNPDPKKFYVSEIRGIDTLKGRIQNNTALHAKQFNKTEENLRKLETLTTQYENKMKPQIDIVKQKNKLILDKLLTVHGLFEKLAIQYNEYDRRPNEEMRVHNQHEAMENVPNELRNKLLDVRMSLDDIRMAPTKKKKYRCHAKLTIHIKAECIEFNGEI